jgi:hypothetical protein
VLTCCRGCTGITLNKLFRSRDGEFNIIYVTQYRNSISKMMFDGLAMSVSNSSIFSEHAVQFIEDTYTRVVNMLLKNHANRYSRYVGDTLIVQS